LWKDKKKQCSKKDIVKAASIMVKWWKEGNCYYPLQQNSLPAIIQ